VCRREDYEEFPITVDVCVLNSAVVMCDYNTKIYVIFS